MSTTIVFFGSAVLALLLAGYLGQRFMPPPKPKIIGIDLGTTYSCVGMYHSVSGLIDILDVQDGHRCIPSVVTFSDEGVSVGYRAVGKSTLHFRNTLYDAKRFIGKIFDDQQLTDIQSQYPFRLVTDDQGAIHYLVTVNGTERRITPEMVGSFIIKTLHRSAESRLSMPVKSVVMSVPAEFDGMQRNRTKLAATLAGLDVARLISEPTAAALAYGLHKRPGLHNVLVVDLGGGTLDVSLLHIQGGMFLTQAMAGNNRLGGQDFNQRLLGLLLRQVERRYGRPLTDPTDLRALLSQVEEAKLNLSSRLETIVRLTLRSFGHALFSETIPRSQFEEVNADLFRHVLLPIGAVLDQSGVSSGEVDEVVLVGGSTRIPMVRQLIGEYFGRPPNTDVDPELAVVKGVSIQAGIIGGMWPLTVSAVERPTTAHKVHIH